MPAPSPSCSESITFPKDMALNIQMLKNFAMHDSMMEGS